MGLGKVALLLQALMQLQFLSGFSDDPHLSVTGSVHGAV